jgi:hypothetical protein
MPRPRRPYLHRERTRNGAIAWYVRRDKGRRIRIKGAFGSPEFKAAYDAALAGEATPVKAGPSTASLAWLIARYRDSHAWAKLSPATKRQRENIFIHVIASAGDAPYAKITRKTITAGIDRRKDTRALRDFAFGRKMRSTVSRRTGRSGRASAWHWRSCFIQGCDAATPWSSGGNISVMALFYCAPKRRERQSLSRFCPSLPKLLPSAKLAISLSSQP